MEEGEPETCRQAKKCQKSGRLLLSGQDMIIPAADLAFFACRLAFVRYLVMERNMDPVEAVKESWRMTKGRAGDILLIGLLAALIWIAGLICLGVGIIPAVMWTRCAFASMYYAVTEAENQKE
jgi:uncharacterized membrane protein